MIVLSLSSFSEWIERVNPILNSVSSLATIGGVVAIVITVMSYKATLQQLKHSADREQKADTRVAIKESIAVLKVFSEKIIPDIEKAERLRQPKIDEVEKDFIDSINKDLPEKDKITKIPSRAGLTKSLKYYAMSLAGYGEIFNMLEQISVYMNYGLVDTGLVYGPLHHVFLTFYEQNQDYLKYISNDEAPYSNVCKLYENWKDLNTLDVNHRKQNELKAQELEILNKRKH